VSVATRCAVRRTAAHSCVLSAKRFSTEKVHVGVCVFQSVSMCLYESCVCAPPRTNKHTQSHSLKQMFNLPATQVAFQCAAMLLAPAAVAQEHRQKQINTTTTEHTLLHN
jgi:hypothetical protein